MEPVQGVIVGSGNATDDVSAFITAAQVSLTANMVSQVTFTIADPDLTRLKANYYQFRQKVSYVGQRWEVAAIQVRQGAACEEVILTCRLEAIQKLKRSKGAQVFREGSPTAFAKARADEVGLEFFGEDTPAKGNISRVRNDTTDESTWDVLGRLASENQFMLFETDGRLFFCSQQFLLGKFALASSEGGASGFLATKIDWSPTGQVTLQESSVPTIEQTYDPIVGPDGRPDLSVGIRNSEHVVYLQTVLKQRAGQDIVVDGWFGNQTKGAVENLQRFYNLPVTGFVSAQTWEVVDLLASGVTTKDSEDSQYRIYPIGVPTLRRSDDASDEVAGSFQAQREYGRLLRPGMTVEMVGVPGFEAFMIVQSVTWNAGSVQPVNVNVSTPQIPQSPKEREAALAKTDLTGGGFGVSTAGQVLL